MYDVVTNPKQKDRWLQIRIDPNFKREVQVVADAKGLSVSALVHSLLKQAVREERDLYPQSFKAESKVVAHISPPEPFKDEREQIRHEFQQGIPLAPNSERTMPAKLDKTTHKAKRKA